MTEPEFICKLQDFIKKKYQNNAGAAKAWIVSPQFVGQVLKAKARPTEDMIKDMGYRKTEHTVIDYKRVRGAK